MEYKPTAIFYELMFAALFGLAVGVFVLLRGQKPKKDFQHLTGAVTSLSKSLGVEGHLNLNNEPVRYVQVRGHQRFFRVFIGEDLDGSKPDFERIDDLKVGDVVTVYYDETPWSSNSDLVSNLIYFIDKGTQPYFVRGKQNNRTGYYLMSACTLVAVVSVGLKRVGKIS